MKQTVYVNQLKLDHHLTNKARFGLKIQFSFLSLSPWMSQSLNISFTHTAYPLHIHTQKKSFYHYINFFRSCVCRLYCSIKQKLFRLQKIYLKAHYFMGCIDLIMILIAFLSCIVTILGLHFLYYSNKFQDVNNF